MKTAIKLITALAAIAGAIYVISTYGDQIVAWAKKIREKLPVCEVTISAEDDPAEDADQACEEKAPEEEAPVQEAATEQDFEA